MRVQNLIPIMDRDLTIEIIKDDTTIFFGTVDEIPDTTIQDLLVVEINPVANGNSTIQEIYTIEAKKL